LLKSGNGVPKYATKAVHWFQQAADHGHAKAQLNLGVCYANGDGVGADKVRALMWFRLAARGGNERAAAYTNQLESMMPPADVEAANRLVDGWTCKSHR